MNPKYLTQKMKEELSREENKNPLLFAPDQYELYIPSWEHQVPQPPHIAYGNRFRRWIGKGTYSHRISKEDLRARFGGHVAEDQVERMIDLQQKLLDMDPGSC